MKKRFFSKIKTIARQALLLTLASTTLAFSGGLSSASALSKEQLKLFYKDYILDFNVRDDSCGTTGPGGGGQAGTGTPSGGAGVRKTNIQPPYYLEIFAIETLRSVALKRSAPIESAITEEHVIGLIAFMFGEGGDINNTSSVFNPLNTGLNDPELIDGRAAGDGTQAFKSFDAGVEATARTIVGSFQSRLGEALTGKESTAEQFMESLSYWYRFPGNHPWAEASRGREADYYLERLSLVKQVRTRYPQMAGLQLGNRDILEQQANMIVPSDKLVYKGAGTGSSTAIGGGTANQSCGGGGAVAGCAEPFSSTIAGEILAHTAKCLAWPSKGKKIITPAMKQELGGDGGRSIATTQYANAMDDVNKSYGVNPYSDCGVFVSTVILATGIDPQYPKRSTGVQANYVRTSPKWKVFENYTGPDPSGKNKERDLRPGDVLIDPINHTYMYTGLWDSEDPDPKNPTKKIQFNSAQASLADTSNGTPPEAQNFYSSGGYLMARFIGTPGTSNGRGVLN
ncbi:MAG TPA: hypothetical protein VF733_00415 [Candidatus Saccharimonadales bacterium]